MSKWSDCFSQIGQGNLSTAFDIAMTPSDDYSYIQDNTALATEQWTNLYHQGAISVDEFNRRMNNVAGFSLPNSLNLPEFSTFDSAITQTKSDIQEAITSVKNSVPSMSDVKEGLQAVDSSIKIYMVLGIVILVVVAIIIGELKF